MSSSKSPRSASPGRRAESPSRKRTNIVEPNGIGNSPHDSAEGDSSSASTSEDDLIPKKKSTPPPPRRQSSPMINSSAKGLINTVTSTGSSLSGSTDTSENSAELSSPRSSSKKQQPRTVTRSGSVSLSISVSKSQPSSEKEKKPKRKIPKSPSLQRKSGIPPPVPPKRQTSSINLPPPTQITVPQAREKLQDNLGIRVKRTPSFHVRGSRLLTAAAANINAAFGNTLDSSDSLSSPKASGSSDSIASLARPASAAAVPSSSLNYSSPALNLQNRISATPTNSPRPQQLKRTASEPFLNTWEFKNLEVDLWIPEIGFILERWQKLRTKKQPPAKPARVVRRERRGSSEGFSIGELEEKIKSKIEEAKEVARDESDLVLEDDGESEGKVIMAGTLNKLLRALADHNTSDKEYIDIFLSTHTHFISTKDLFAALKAQFNDPVQDTDLSALEQMQYANLIRLRIINVFKKWLRYHDYDFQTSEPKKAMEAFIDFLDSQAEHKQYATFLKQAWHRLNTVSEDGDDVNFPKSLLPSKKKLEDLNCLEMAPTEMARQLSLIHFKLFAKIQNPQLISVLKEGKDKDPSNPVTQISLFSDRITRWAATEIVVPDMKKRVSVVCSLIKLADRLAEMNNFHGSMDIFLALSHYAIGKLKRTWKSIGKNASQQWKKLLDLFNPIGGWRNLRKKILVAPTPVIIPPAIWLHDLLAIEENDDFWDNDKRLINFEKMRLFAGVFKNVYRCQVEPYPFAPVDIMQEYFEKQAHTLSMDDVETMVTQLVSTESSGEGTPTKLKRRPSVGQLLKNKLMGGPKKDKGQ